LGELIIKEVKVVLFLCAILVFLFGPWLWPAFFFFLSPKYLQNEKNKNKKEIFCCNIPFLLEKSQKFGIKNNKIFCSHLDSDFSLIAFFFWGNKFSPFWEQTFGKKNILLRIFCLKFKKIAKNGGKKLVKIHHNCLQYERVIKIIILSHF
jgi:hypothetical protein